MRLFGLLLLLCAPARAKTVTGFEVLSAGNFAPFSGKRVGLITNHTGTDSGGRSIAGAFASHGSFRLAAIFSPEHGFSGRAAGGDLVGDSSYNGVPVRSLYGKTMRPDWGMLKDIDILVFDMQDIGARFYTYLSTMGMAMEEADKYGIPFYVLDRPNPVGGEIAEGPVPPGPSGGLTQYFPVPVRHGMTAGEMALLHADVKKLRLAPEVIRMKGWKRGMFYDETGLQWVNPSPNIRDLDAAILYQGLGCFEAVNISVGRGTDSPFHWFGAPWLDAKALVSALEKAHIKGAEFRCEERTPSDDIYAGKTCKGVSIRITRPKKIRPLEIFVSVLCLLRDMKQPGLEIRWDAAGKMTGSGNFRALYESGASPEEILSDFDKTLKPFMKSRGKYLLYN
ncbi:MAG: DUF1343 domain-containing protein [Elusimicrobiales bacterium]